VARKGRRFDRIFHADGLLEIHQFEHLRAVTASGVGGGSHIYTSILEEPEKELFDAYPDEITHQEMRPYFERVRDMLRPAPVPHPPEKVRVFEQATRAAGLPAPEHPDLAIAWGDDPNRPKKIKNAGGVEQTTSTYRGDAFIGCEDGSKTTLDLTYLPLALHNEAELRPLCEVIAVGTEDGAGTRSYTVHYRDHRTGEGRSDSAPRLVLAAGGLNTQRLLFDAREGRGSLPDLPATLGKRFSSNADFAVFLWRNSNLRDSSYGPSFGAFSRIKENGRYRFLLGEVGTTPEAFPVPGLVRGWLRRSTFLFCMGRETSTGTTSFERSSLITSVDRCLDPALYDEMERLIRRVAKHYEPKRILPRILSGKDPEGLFTVHPLGGCSIGSDPEKGFTDHRGEVFGYPGLFVADGSLYPCSPGIAPSMTIAALAERQAALMD
jgi:cholesterol oxidase